MKPVLGTLGDKTLVILTPAEVDRIRTALTIYLKERGTHSGGTCLSALNAGIARGTAHMQTELTDRLKKK